MRPLIGVTASRHRLNKRPDNDLVYLAFVSYAIMVRAAGGIPVALVPGAADEAPQVLDRLDGVVLSGGGDVDPGRYRGDHHDTVYGVDPGRDAFEIAMVRTARERRFPTLCICRGMQLVNVAFGGTLIADIASEGPGLVDHRHIAESAGLRSHIVDLTPGSSTARALGGDVVEVNSLHHQAVRDVAPGFVVTGRAPDGMIEALAPEEEDWPMWAVQWHPEGLGPGDEPSLALFRTFVEAAAEATSLRP
jgi:putative glutamine amidotransferase